MRSRRDFEATEGEHFLELTLLYRKLREPSDRFAQGGRTAQEACSQRVSQQILGHLLCLNVALRPTCFPWDWRPSPRYFIERLVSPSLLVRTQLFAAPIISNSSPSGSPFRSNRYPIPASRQLKKNAIRSRDDRLAEETLA